MSDNGHPEGDVSRQLVDLVGQLTVSWLKWLQRTAAPAGLTPARLRVLGTLYHEGPLIMNALAEQLGVTPRNITALIDGLEQDALVERRRHPSDRRATVIALTALGHKLTESWWDEHIERTGEIFDAISERDQRTLLRILQKLEGPLAERVS